MRPRSINPRVEQQYDQLQELSCELTQINNELTLSYKHGKAQGGVLLTPETARDILRTNSALKI